MQFQPPQQGYNKDVSIPIAPAPASQGVDHNGIVLGRWKAPLFGFVDSLIPNAAMSLLCPGITLAQISARLGLLSYLTVMGCWFLLLLLAIVASFITSGFMDTIVVIGAFIMSASCWRLRWRVRKLFSIPGSVVEDLLYTLFCGCCSIAQMASHVESYTPGACTWSPRNTLEGYNGN